MPKNFCLPPKECFLGVKPRQKANAYRRRYGSHAKAICDITEYIEMFYNRQRRQTALGYLSPAAFARKVQEEQLGKAA